MFKWATMVGVLSLSLVAMLGGDAEAHLAGTVKIGGYLRHVSSLGCGITVGGVPNPDTNPSSLICTVTIKSVEFLCLNPNSNQVNPGRSARRTVVIGTAEFSSEGINKKKGTGTAEARIDSAAALTNDDCVNPNWSVIPESVVVLTAEVEYKTVECNNLDCTNFVVAYTEQRDCTLPPGFGIDPGEEFPAVNTEYTCPLISREHVK